MYIVHIVLAVGKIAVWFFFYSEINLMISQVNY